MRLVFSALLILIVTYAIEGSISNQSFSDTRRIPEIKPGGKCVKGQVYRMDCNTCHCGENNNLLCTKMGCLNGPKIYGHNNILRKSEGCTPGKLYKKGCQKCFCTEKGRLKCGQQNNCKLADRVYTNPEHIKPLTSAEFYKLPSLPHQGMECQPGKSYRIDCNTCFCLESGNLMCQKLLCPSYDDVYRIKAKEMTGKPCDTNSSTSEECLNCLCNAGKYKCEQKPSCSHTDGRRMIHGEYPSEHDRNFIDLEQMKKDCKPGMVYKVHCNNCYCQEDGSLRCTQKTCLNHAEIERLKRLRLKLAKEDPED